MRATLKSKMNLKPVLLFAIMCCLALPAGAAAIPTLFNTGVSSNDRFGSPEILIPEGQPDPHYSVIGGIVGALSPMVTGSESYPFPPWSPDSATSEWISPQAAYAGFLRDPVGIYTYMTTFDLTGFDARSVSISGQAVADNAIAAIRINGFNINYTQATTTFALAPFTIPKGHYASGINTLEFTVYNRGNLGGGNPSGLRVEVSGTGAASNIKDDGQFTVLLVTDSDDEEGPQGTGYGTLTAGGKGGVVFSGRLPDGESFSTSGVIDTGTAGSSVGISGRLIYPSTTPKGATGTLSGVLNFETASIQGNITGDVDGDLEWTKPAQTAGSDRESFETDLFVRGSIYAFVPGSSVLPGFPAVGGTTSGTLEISDYTGLDLQSSVQLSSSNQLVVANPPVGLKITIFPSNGTFRGTFLYPGSVPKLTEISGVLYQDQGIGVGFFVGPNGTGQVTISQ
jgi:hypothetical protein